MTPRFFTYRSWKSMFERCYNPKNPSYKHYGAKGITVCERWHSFPSFLDDMGFRPKGKTLDRKDNHKEYSPENCKWSTPIEQNSNRSSVVLVSHEGKTLTLASWSRELGISPQVLHHRIRKLNLPPSVALTLPVDRAKTKQVLRTIK